MKIKFGRIFEDEILLKRKTQGYFSIYNFYLILDLIRYVVYGMLKLRVPSNSKYFYILIKVIFFLTQLKILNSFNFIMARYYIIT